MTPYFAETMTLSVTGVWMLFWIIGVWVIGNEWVFASVIDVGVVFPTPFFLSQELGLGRFPTAGGSIDVLGQVTSQMHINLFLVGYRE